jgi:DNA-binding CsgD family transcriptional regulator
VLIGRDREVAVLDDALDSVVIGRGAFVSIRGPAGVGKSRLARELVERARARVVKVVAGRAVPASAISPYRPITEALLQLLRTTWIPDDAALTPWLPHLGALLPGVVDAPLMRADADDRRWVALCGEAFLRLVARVAGGPVLVLLEDLHWADPETVALVEYLADNLLEMPVLLAATVRSEEESAALDLVHRQRARPAVVPIELGRLDAAAVDEMVEACGGAAPARRSWIRRTAEGLPQLIEALLASPGVPDSIASYVGKRLSGLAPSERSVVEAAAVVGRHFSWELLADVTGQPLVEVTAALERAVERQLIVSDGDAFRFRHAVTREGVLATILPPRHRTLASAALRALEAAHPAPDPERRDLAVDLALRAGERERAGLLLVDSGRDALEVGALQTAIDVLRRAVPLLDRATSRRAAELVLVEALSFAGRVDEAVDVGRQLAERLEDDPTSIQLKRHVHLRLATAAVAATRWRTATEHLRAVEELGIGLAGDVASTVAVLSAEIALAGDDLVEARRQADRALAADRLDPDARCRALEILGRSERLRDLGAARAMFEAALTTAEHHRLPLARLRALHELGTIDMFGHAGVDRLSEARRRAEEMGAISTVATLDLQLSACYTSRWDLDGCDRHANAALDVAQRLGLDLVRAKALALLTGSASMRADPERTDHLASLTLAAAPGDRMLLGFTLACRGMCGVLGDEKDALEVYGQGMAVLAGLPNAEPASNRALWPLVLASVGDRRAAAAIGEARSLRVEAFDMNRGLILCAEAVLAGRAGEPRRAERLEAAARPLFANGEGWAVLARFLAAPAARAGGWGAPDRWLTDASAVFEARGLDVLARRAVQLRRSGDPNPWAAYGITDREAGVLRLVGEGLTNKEIAVCLIVSPRTVEKHVENLLRKTGCRSRVDLAVYATAATT